MIKRTAAVITVILSLAVPFGVYAAEKGGSETTIEDVADMFGLSEADSGLESIADEYGLEDFSLRETALDIVSGNYDFSVKNIVGTIFKAALGQAGGVLHTMKRIMVLVLLAAVMEMLSSSFSSGGVSKLGQYVCSAVLVMTVMQSFYYAAETVTEAVQNISDASKTLQPVYMLIMTASGRAAKMSAAVPVLYASASVLNFIVGRLVVPGILFAALITFINCMSERDMLMELADLMGFICKWSVKLCAGAFVFVMSLIKIGVPDVAVIAGKSIKTAAEAVPVVGSLMSSAAETAAAVTGAMGNSVTAALMIFIVLVSIMPVIRLALIMLVYKLTAALTEPVAPKRIVKCISKAADYTAVLTGVVFTAEIMFITVTALMLSV